MFPRSLQLMTRSQRCIVQFLLQVNILMPLIKASVGCFFSSEQVVAEETVFLRSYCRSCTSPYLSYLMLLTTLCQLCFTEIRTSGLSVGFPGGVEGKESACNAGDPGSVPGLGRFPGEGNGNPLQYSCLENPMDRGAWQQFMESQRVGHN